MTGIGVDGDEEIGALAVRDGSAGFERDEGIVLAGVDDFSAEPGFELAAKTLGDIKYEVFFEQAIGTDGACVVPSMAGIDNDLADLETERANEGAIAGGGRTSFMDLGPGVVGRFLFARGLRF